MTDLEMQNVKLKKTMMNYPIGSKVIVKDNSRTPYEVGIVHGYQLAGSNHFILVNIEGKDKNPHLIMGIIRPFDERRNQALDKLDGVEQWNVMSEFYCFEE